MRAVVAVGASCLTLGFTGAAVVAAIHDRRQHSEYSEWSLFAFCWAGVAGVAGIVALGQWVLLLQ
ncbi:hypothetical protein [Rathayibacter agropyri]|uniref:hypothetical protein n=1 Tax=Rathayibacter agropyri TaxID=1634927 RepID=UPI001565FA55|nr:hypothetical protein [Rathayibacter agropyri]NRD08893.1 hypothetical protein [Rathayibacter agropyri]